MEVNVQRRLAAILATDVVGYSRLMEKDEVGTLAVLKARRKDVLEPLVARHNGRIFKLTGDGVLIEFASAVNAVQCAVDFQAAIASANADMPDETKIVVRIGVHLGDVMVEGSDLYGDGVNIAARLEGIADPGGICLSEDAFRQVRNKLDCAFDDLGAQKLKNIAEPVRAYRIAAPRPAQKDALPLPDKPSIAVLPFANMSGDPEQEYFSDGITEDIITELSRFRSLFVIARNSSFQYRGKNVDVRRVARELGVQYIAEGSVRKMGDRVRITTQLIDTAAGNHLWSERFDRAIDELFLVQDEVVRTLVATLEVRVAAAISEQARRKRTENLGAYECVLRGIKHLRGYGPDDNKRAVELFQRAIELDPDYALARAYRGFAEVVMHGYADAPDVVLKNALRLAKLAVEQSEEDGRCHWILGMTYAYCGDRAAAMRHYERAIALNPNDANTLVTSAVAVAMTGRAGEAEERIRRAMRLNPYHPQWYWTDLAMVLYAARRYAEALEALDHNAQTSVWLSCRKAACFAQLGRIDEASAIAAEVIKKKPDFSIRNHKLILWDETEAEHIRDGMRKAGLPE